MSINELKLETKCYDANEYGYLYGLNQKIPDEEFEKIKGYMRKFSKILLTVLLKLQEDQKDTDVLKKM